MYPSKDTSVDFRYGVKYKKFSGVHKGVDFFVPVGTKVFAAVGGTVVHAGKQNNGGWKNRGWGGAYGTHIIVDNNRLPDGSAGLWSGYMHLSKVNVKQGDVVRKGQLLGYSGNTGRTTGPHIHFEVQKTRFWSRIGHVNPQKLLDC